MKQTISKCPKCGSGCLWYKPDGTVLCTVCMKLMDKEGNQCTSSKSNKSGN